MRIKKKDFEHIKEYVIPQEILKKTKLDKRKKRNKDKVFDNSFNLGETSFEDFQDAKPDESYSASYLNPYYNSNDYNTLQELQMRIVEAFEYSHYNTSNLREQKFPKSILGELYNFLIETCQDIQYSHCDMFLAVSDSLNIPARKLYESIDIEYKKEILVEFNEKYKRLKTSDDNLKLF